MNDNGHTESASLGPDGALEKRVAQALAGREEAVDAALRGDDARGSDDTFVEDLRAEWVGEAPMLVAVSGGEPESARPGPRRTNTLRWMPLAAAAAVLVGAWSLGLLPGVQRGGTPDPADTGGPSGVYLGTEGEDETRVFDGTVDWSGELDGVFLFDIVIRDADPSKFGEDAVVHEESDLITTSYACPDDVKKKLPREFFVEVYDAELPDGSPLVLRLRYRQD